MTICSQEAAFARERESHAATGRRCREIAIALARSAPPMFERRPACALLSKSAYAFAAAAGNLTPRRTICSGSLASGVRLSRNTALRSAGSADRSVNLPEALIGDETLSRTRTFSLGQSAACFANVNSFIPFPLVASVIGQYR